eukprot:355767-Chlamydomonas_euryale.AAC.10
MATAGAHLTISRISRDVRTAQLPTMALTRAHPVRSHTRAPSAPSHTRTHCAAPHEPDTPPSARPCAATRSISTAHAQCVCRVWWAAGSSHALWAASARIELGLTLSDYPPEDAAALFRERQVRMRWRAPTLAMFCGTEDVAALLRGRQMRARWRSSE